MEDIQLGQENKYRFYLEKTRKTINLKQEIPELYYGETSTFNENTPLGWTHAIYSLALK